MPRDPVQSLLDEVSQAWLPPEDYWVMSTSGVNYQISAEEAARILHLMETAGTHPLLIIEFTDCLGGKCTTFARDISDLYESTLELRNRRRTWDEADKRERGFSDG